MGTSCPAEMLVREMHCSSMIFYLVTLLFLKNFYYALKNTSCLLLVFITFSSSSLCYDLVFSEDSASSQSLSNPCPVFETGGILIFRLPLVWIYRSWPRRAPGLPRPEIAHHPGMPDSSRPSTLRLFLSSKLTP